MAKQCASLLSPRQAIKLVVFVIKRSCLAILYPHTLHIKRCWVAAFSGSDCIAERVMEYQSGSRFDTTSWERTACCLVSMIHCPNTRGIRICSKFTRCIKQKPILTISYNLCATAMQLSIKVSWITLTYIDVEWCFCTCHTWIYPWRAMCV